MPILRFGKQIRLTGDNATQFVKDTGRSRLPDTLEEYNQAMDDAADSWMAEGTPEGKLLSYLFKSQKLVEKSDFIQTIGDLDQPDNPPSPAPLYLKDQISGQIKLTQFGLEQYAIEFAKTGIEIASIKTEADFEKMRLSSIQFTTAELMCKTADYPELDKALEPFITALKSRLKGSHDAT